MYRFSVKIAGHVAGVESLHVRTKAICRDFITEEFPEFNIHLTQQDIDREREAFQTQYGDCTLWDGSLEPIVLHAKISTKLIDYDCFMMHGVAVAYKNNAYIFTAKSGTGKSTHAIKWIKNAPGAIIINGDKPVITTSMDGKRPMACGTPWAGKENIYTNTMVPLKSIILMERAEENSIEQISVSEAFPAFFQQVFHPDDEGRMRKTLRLMQRLYTDVSFWRFRCNNFKEDCFDVAYNALVGEYE